MITSTFKLEEEILKNGYDFVIGIDEAGRGPLAGPVVACAASLKCHAEFISVSNGESLEILKQVQDDKSFKLIRDSKTLSHKQRESLFDFIQENFHVGVGICDHETIDRMNILEATFLAMKKAVADLMRNLKRVEPRMIILLDGNKPIPNFSAEQKAIVNGDKIVKSISAASIIAKVTRDRIMLEMHEKYPQYKFDQHKGYGTKLHMEMLIKHGPCKIHRKSFRPVSGLL